MLHCAAERWSWALAKEDEHTMQQAAQIVRLLLEMREDIHAASGRRFTPLTTIGDMIADHSLAPKRKLYLHGCNCSRMLGMISIYTANRMPA
jgi:hypothetical protein